MFEQPSSSCFGLEVCSLVSSPRVLLVAVLLEAEYGGGGGAVECLSMLRVSVLPVLVVAGLGGRGE